VSPARNERARLHLKLLGGFETRLATGAPVTLPTRKAQALLAYLAVRAGHTHARDKLAAFLWGDRGDVQARDSLRHTLVELRKILPERPPSLMGEGRTVTLAPAAIDVDVVHFETLVKATRTEDLARATELYQGDFLDGFVVREPAFEEWLVAERERLRELALGALRRLLEQQTRAAAGEAAIRTALRLLALDATQEVAHRALMRLYTQQGRRAMALRQYQTCVAVLQRELGAEPNAETRQLYQDIIQRRDDVRRREPEGVPASSAKSPAAAAIPHAQAVRTEPSSVEAPLIGRSSELATLGNAFEEARWGRGRVIAIVGEAGVGKSRLVAELARTAAEHDARVLVGRCYESEQILPFGAWIDALRAGHVVPDDAALVALEPAWRAELARLFPEIAVAGLPAASNDARRLFESIMRLASALAANGPVLLVLEDLHWADEMTLRLLAILGRRIADQRMLIVTTVREEELQDAAALRRTLEELRREGRVDEVRLSALSAQDTATLVRSLSTVGIGAEALTSLEAQVWRVSAGNPFMVVETVRALGDAPTLQSSALALPERVRDVISARLERLSERGREFADLAAVIGRDFDFALLQRASGGSERDAADGAEELVRRRVLHGVGERFDFTHDRIREVVYAQILPPRRRLLHREVASAIESLPAEDVGEQTERLAHHALRGELWEKAVAYLRQAGLRAVARSASREAVAYLERALETLRHLPDARQRAELSIDLRIDLRSAVLPLADISRMEGYLREAEATARTLGDQRRLATILGLSVMPLLNTGRYEEAVQYGRDGLAIATGLGDRKIEASILPMLAMVLAARGEFREAIELLERDVSLLQGDLLYERLGQGAFGSVFARSYLADALAQVGRFDDAIAHGEDAVRLAEVLTHPFSLSFGLFDLGLAHVRRGDPARAITVLERCLDVCRTSEIVVLTPFVGATLGGAYALANRFDEALVLVGSSIDQFRERALHRRPALIPLFAAMTCRLAGRFDEAAAHAREALALARRLGARGSETEALALSGASALDLGAVGADACYREALTLADQLGMRPLVAHCHLGLANVYRRMQKRELAREHLTTAAAMYREMAMRRWCEEVEAALRES
jgi:DNA-binding SARP family transcriptional activator